MRGRHYQRPETDKTQPIKPVYIQPTQHRAPPIPTDWVLIFRVIGYAVLAAICVSFLIFAVMSIIGTVAQPTF